MGLSDREYYQDEQRGISLGNRSMAVNLILVNVAVWVATLVEPRLGGWLALKPDVLQHPLRWYELLTYGFVHDTQSNVFLHIFFNMYGLWLFGSQVEGIYGKAEFLRLYLTAIVFCGLVFSLVGLFTNSATSLIGASGGVMALLILFVLHFPRQIILVWFLPMPAWALGGLYVLLDLSQLGSGDGVSHLAHLAGVAYGAWYFKTGWSLGRIVPRRLSLPKFRPRLKIHDPAAESQSLNEQVDQILEKISRTGESSLTKKERDTLEKASRRYQRRRP